MIPFKSLLNISILLVIFFATSVNSNNTLFSQQNFIEDKNDIYEISIQDLTNFPLEKRGLIYAISDNKNDIFELQIDQLTDLSTDDIAILYLVSEYKNDPYEIPIDQLQEFPIEYAFILNCCF